jgi:hypothetical protein
MGDCLVCKRVFTFNPIKVPSFRVNGERQPVCLRCMYVVNEERAKKGFVAFQIHEDAYEACNENELPED